MLETRRDRKSELKRKFRRGYTDWKSLNAEATKSNWAASG